MVLPVLAVLLAGVKDFVFSLAFWVHMLTHWGQMTPCKNSTCLDLCALKMGLKHHANRDQKSTRKSANLPLDQFLLQEAKSFGVNFFQAAETGVGGDLNTRVFVPLLASDKAPKPAKRLNPVLKVKAEPHVVVIRFTAAVPVSMLQAPIDILSGNAGEVTNALDLVFFGI